jgi:hypothetical protein
METSSAGNIPSPRCCCGSTDCAFLAHNGRLLEGLERDVSKAAQLGQVRLLSHCRLHTVTMQQLLPLVLLPSPTYYETDACALTYLLTAGPPYPP